MNQRTGMRKSRPSVWALACALLIGGLPVLADAPDKVRDLTKARQAERDRAVANIPIVAPEEVYRRWFEAMKTGRFAEASRFIAEDSLRAMKAVLIRSLRAASLEERADFIKAAGFKSASEVQHASSTKVFAGWMQSGWRLRGALERIRQGEVAGVQLARRGEGQLLVVELKSAGGLSRQEVACEQQEREWRLKIEFTPVIGVRSQHQTFSLR